jgi:hypothetical protein
MARSVTAVDVTTLPSSGGRCSVVRQYPSGACRYATNRARADLDCRRHPGRVGRNKDVALAEAGIAHVRALNCAIESAGRSKQFQRVVAYLANAPYVQFDAAIFRVAEREERKHMMITGDALVFGEPLLGGASQQRQ